MNFCNFRTLSLSLMLAALLGLTSSAMAAGPYHGQCMTNLSPEKQELVKKMHEDFHDSTKVTRQELISKKHELDAMLYSANPDEKKIQNLTKEISDLRAKLYTARITLKGKLIKEGIILGPGSGKGRGHGMGCGMDCGRGHGGRGMGRDW